jgi:hypothetical protein
MPPCLRCTTARVKKDGRVGATQRFRRSHCRRTFTGRTGTPFAGHRWPQEVIVTAVRGTCASDCPRPTCATCSPSGASTSPRGRSSIGSRNSPRCWRGRGTETYVRVGGTWAYLYRAIDEHGQVMDVLLRARRDLDSTRAFFVLAPYRRRAAPEKVITDKHPAYERAVRDEVPGHSIGRAACTARTGRTPRRSRGPTSRRRTGYARCAGSSPSAPDNTSSRGSSWRGRCSEAT